MIYDCVNTKPPLEELCLEHGWLKDNISRIHKYISKHRSKNGKWVYVYSKNKSAMKGDSRYRNVGDLKDRGYSRAEGNRIGTITKEKKHKTPMGYYKYFEKSGIYNNRSTTRALNTYNKIKGEEKRRAQSNKNRFLKQLNRKNNRKMWFKFI